MSLTTQTSRPDARRLGIDRVLDPPGSLPHIAHRLDATAEPSEYEAVLDVEQLAIDATSYRAIRERCKADPRRMADTITAIVAERGKLQNPWTSSGGVLLGRVRTVGARSSMHDLPIGELVVPLASAIAIPLELHDVGPVDPTTPHVPVRGRAIVTGAMVCARLPTDLTRTAALTALDVYPAASHVRTLASEGDHVLILGSGHAGLLALAAAREAVGADGSITVVDMSDQALARARRVDHSAAMLEADVTVPLAVASQLGRPADLTLQCTSVAGAEGTAILATADRGTVVFFSTATSFAAAALGADAIGSHAQLIIPNGLTDDRGEYAFELLRRVPALRDAFEAAQ
jgi:L-erythro-3,5-diaminohexanoate dehydrogenase